MKMENERVEINDPCIVRIQHTVIDTIIHFGTNFKGKLNTGNSRLFNNK